MTFNSRFQLECEFHATTPAGFCSQVGSMLGNEKLGYQQTDRAPAAGGVEPVDIPYKTAIERSLRAAAQHPLSANSEASVSARAPIALSSPPSRRIKTSSILWYSERDYFVLEFCLWRYSNEHIVRATYVK